MLFEGGVEGRTGVESAFKRGLQDAHVIFLQEDAGVRNPMAVDVAKLICAEVFAECFREVIFGHVHRVGNISQ